MPHATTCNVQRATCVYCNFIKCKIVTAKIATTSTARTVVHNAHSVAIRAENYYGLQSDPSLSLPLQLPLFVSPTPSAWLNRLQFMTGSCQLWFALWSTRGCGLWSVECGDCVGDGYRLWQAPLDTNSNSNSYPSPPCIVATQLVSESGMSNL